ncbi:disease resistance-like protein DSC1 [Fagus crenata]
MRCGGLVAGLLARYGPTQFYDYFGELTKLQQTGSVRDYQSRFENLLAKAGHLPPARQVSCFISGLKEGIKADVLAGRPVDLSTAIGLARLYEARNLSQRRPLPASTNVSQKVNKEESSSRHPSAIRRMKYYRGRWLVKLWAHGRFGMEFLCSRAEFSLHLTRQ